MSKAHLIALVIVVFASATWAEDVPANWYDGDGPSAPWFLGQEPKPENIKAIQSCLTNSSDKNTCEELSATLAHDGPNWGSAAAQHANEWSIIGQQYIDKMIERNPNKAASIKAAQSAWYASTKKRCESQRDTATYEDDDAEGNHPPFYDWVTYISCVYGETMDRVWDLRNQASN